MRIRLTQLDGPWPNLALMRLADWHRGRGDRVSFSRDATPEPGEGGYDRVYASVLFEKSRPKLDILRRYWPDAVIGGGASGSALTTEVVTGVAHTGLDYGFYPDFRPSIGYSQRGCRGNCRFCAVPGLEGGQPLSVASIGDIWRGPGHARQILLLDADFFGQPEWRRRTEELQDFRVCFSQGINLRTITADQACALAGLEYRDSKFQRRRLYTAWDRRRDEGPFLRGVERLTEAGIPARHLMVYMLVGFDRAETWADIWHRFDTLVALGARPFVMVHHLARRQDLVDLSRWVNRGLHRILPWSAYRRDYRRQSGSSMASHPTT